jgi:hypothetical protein
MCRKIGDNKPSAVFETRAEMYITVPAIPTPPGMTAPDAAIGEAYIRRTDGTPKLKRSINFTSPSLDDENDAAPAVTQVIVANPKYITDDEWTELRAWVHTWFLQRIPDRHQHLVADVKEGDILNTPGI